MGLSPTSDTARQRPYLGQALWEALSGMDEFIALMVMRRLFTPRDSGEFAVLPIEELFNLRDVNRTDRGTYNRSTGNFESGFFKTTEKGLEAQKDRRQIAKYKDMFDYELALGKLTYRDILRAFEAVVAGKVFNTTNFTAHAVTTKWTVAATATPQADVQAGKKAMLANGVPANALIISESTSLDLQVCDDVKTAIFQMFPDAAKSGKVTQEHLKTYFDLPYILVGKALKNTADKGQPASLSPIWDNQYAMLCRIAEADEEWEPCIGRTFIWQEGSAGSGEGEEAVIVEDYPDDPSRSDILRCRWDIDPCLLQSYDENGTPKSTIYKSCGYLLSNIT